MVQRFPMDQVVYIIRKSDDKEIALCTRHIYCYKRTNKDDSQFWTCQMPRCNASITTKDDCVFKINGKLIQGDSESSIQKTHKDHEPISDEKFNQFINDQDNTVYTKWSEQDSKLLTTETKKGQVVKNRITSNNDFTIDEINTSFGQLELRGVPTKLVFDNSSLLTISSSSELDLTEASSSSEEDDVSIENNFVPKETDSIMELLKEIEHVEFFTASKEMNQLLKTMNGTKYSIAVLLNYVYDTKNLETQGINVLRDVDKKRFSLLETASEDLNSDEQLVFYIARTNLVIEKHKNSRPDSGKKGSGKKGRRKKPSWEEDDRSLSIEDIHDVNGQSVFQNALVSIDFFTKFIAPNIESDSDLDKTDIWGEDTAVVDQNETVCHIYQTTTFTKYLLIFWPKRFEFDLLTEIDYKSAVDLYFREYSSNALNQTSRHNLAQLIKQFNVQSSHFEYLFDKFLEILLNVHDTKIIKEFIKKVMSNTSSMNQAHIPKLVTLIELLEPVCLIDFFKKFATKNLLNDCLLLESLLESINKNISNIYFEASIVPLLDKQETQFPKFSNDPYTYFRLIELLFYFPNKYLEKFTEKVLNKLDQESLKTLVEYLIVNHAAECTKEPLIELVIQRINWLRELLRKKPVFSYNMKCEAIEDKQVEEFLKSNRREFTYSGVFNGIGQVREFISLFGVNGEGYSIEMHASGVGKKAQVHIVKTRAFFERELAKFEEARREMKSIEKLKLKLKF